MSNHPLAGVYAAAVTPLKKDLSPDLEAIPLLLDFLARRGCNGALILGTTGEGSSFSSQEKLEIWKAAIKIRQQHPNFKLMAGTGTPSLEESVSLTKYAFQIGFDAVVVLPPYYYRNADEDGLYTWFSQLIKQAVPSDGNLLGYHFPQVAGIGMTIELMSRLKSSFPAQFSGVKDSSGDPKYAEKIVAKLGKDFLTLIGNDKIFSRSLSIGVQGCITALANLFSQELKNVWLTNKQGLQDNAAQNKLNLGKDILSRYPSAAATIKSLLHSLHDLPKWPVKPPLTPLNEENEKRVLRMMMRANNR